MLTIVSRRQRELCLHHGLTAPALKLAQFDQSRMPARRRKSPLRECLFLKWTVPLDCKKLFSGRSSLQNFIRTTPAADALLPLKQLTEASANLPKTYSNPDANRAVRCGRLPPPDRRQCDFCQKSLTRGFGRRKILHFQPRPRHKCGSEAKFGNLGCAFP